MAVVYRRGRIWWVRFHLNGRHVRRSAHTERKSEAQAFLLRLMDQFASQARGDRAEHSYADAVERFFKEASLKPRTRATYRSNDKACRATFGPLYRLSRVLGHSTLQMSARYGHLRTDDLHHELRTLAQKRSQERQTEAPEPWPEPSAEAPAQPFKPLSVNGSRRSRRLGRNGAPGTIRTSDPQIRSLMLYPAELRARIALRRGRGT